MADTLIDVLGTHVAERPDRPALTFLQDGEDRAITWSYAALDRKARAVAATLQARVAPGERVLLLHPQGLDYVAALLGAMMAGVLAVPLQPPGRHRSAHALPKLEAVVADGGIALALATAATIDDLRAAVAPSPALAALTWLATDTLADAAGARFTPRPLGADDVAYLQYTSGSTSTPKGVIVTHGDLATNLATFDVDYGHDAGSVMVSWLPVFHDLGLVYAVFMPLWGGFPGVLLDPLAFLQRPLRWVRAIHRWRGTHSPAPNFAFDLVAAKTTPEERARLDLSCWKVALNGAEPIRYESEARFVEAFAGVGVSWRTVSHAYGMSEATAVISKEAVGTEPVFLDVDAAALERHRVVPADPGAVGARRIAGCGVCCGDTRVVVVDPDTREALAADRVGELWVGGATRAQGYWRREQESVDGFEARTTGGDGPFLRTGDLGFVHDRQVFVTGRLKDLLIVRGENHYPQDVEWSVQEAHPAIRPSCVAAFAIAHGATDGVGVVAEVVGEPDADAVIARIRDAVAGHGLQARLVALVPPRAIFKTSSGKIMRRRTREALLDGTLAPVARWEAAEVTAAPKEDLAARLTAVAAVDRVDVVVAHVLGWAAARLGFDDPTALDADTPLRELGFDSLQAVELVEALAVDLGRSLPTTLLFDHPTARALAAHLVGAAPRTSPSSPTPVDDDLGGATADELAALIADEIDGL